MNAIDYTNYSWKMTGKSVKRTVKIYFVAEVVSRSLDTFAVCYPLSTPAVV